MPPLDKQNVPIILGSGVDTKTDPKQVVAGTLLTLQNASFQKGKEYTKRNGTQVIGTSISSGNFINDFKSECVAGSQSDVYSYDLSQDTFDLKGSRVAIDLTTSSVIRNSSYQANSDSAFHPSGVSAYTWFDEFTNGVYYCINDTDTGEYIVPPTLLDSASAGTRDPKVVTFGTYFVFFWAQFNAVLIQAAHVNVTTPKIAPVLIGSGLAFAGSTPSSGFTNFYDIKVVNARLFISYPNASNTVTLLYFDSSFTPSSPQTFGTSNVKTIGLLSDAAFNVWVGVSYGSTSSGSVSYYVYDYNLAGQITTGVLAASIPTAAYSITGYVTGTEGFFYFDYNIDKSYPTVLAEIVYVPGSLAGAVGSQTTVALGLSIASRLFQFNGIPYILGFYHSPEVQPTYFLVNQSGQVVAKLAPSTAGGALPGLMSSVNMISATQFQLTYQLSDLVETITGNVYSQSGIQSATFSFEEPTITNVSGENLLMSGAIVYMYDGLTVCELGYNIFPDGITATQSSVGGFMDPGTYQYLVTYEWVDNQGQTHKSDPGGFNGAAVTVVIPPGTSTNEVTLTIPNLTLTQKTGVGIVVYRTEANQGVFFRVNQIGLTPNIPTSATQTFTDTVNDTELNGNELLYTTGGIIENIAAPALSNLVSFNSRVFGITEEDPLTFWYSQQILSNEPVEFNDSFTVRIEERNGPMTSMGVMDTNLIIFKENSVYYMNGSGPAPNGTNNDFSTPQLVTTDTGCSNQRSIVTTPIGIMFQSPKGIYLLDRSLAASYIGAPVEAYNAQTITSAQLMPTRNAVHFTLNSGVILSYNYFFGQWSVYTNQNAADSCVFNELQTYVQPGGVVIQETNGLYEDWDASPVLMSLTTSWLSFAQLQGFQRAYNLMILGDYITPHNLQVTINYDFADELTQVVNIPVQSAPTAGVEQFRVFLDQMKCQAIQVSIQELQPSFTGQGLNISGLSLIAGIKKGQFKVPAAISYGS